MGDMVGRWQELGLKGIRNLTPEELVEYASIIAALEAQIVDKKGPTE